MFGFTEIVLNLLIVMLFVILNGMFVAAEFAIVKVRGSRITQLVNEGNPKAKLAQHVTSKLDSYLSATQLGITLSSLGLGWVGEPAISHMIVEPLLHYAGAPEGLVGPVSLTIGFTIITFLHIVLGELAPKSLAIARAEGVSMWLSGLLIGFYKVTYPAIWVLNGAANALLKAIGIEHATEHQAGHTEDEIRILIRESERTGHIDKDELTLVENIFAFSDRVAREVMIPRVMIECLYTELSFEENLDIVTKTKHTRYPVAREDKDNIIGMIHATDIYQAALAEKDGNTGIDELLRPLPHVPESMEISHVLRVMQKERVQLVVVADEFGGTAGLLAIEDILEEIVGDIHDEFTADRAEIEVLEGRTNVDGRLLLEKVNEMFGVDLEDDEVDTIGGWIYSQLDDQPQAGQTVEFGGLIFEIKEAENFRIHRVEIRAVPVTEEAEDHDVI